MSSGHVPFKSSSSLSHLIYLVKPEVLGPVTGVRLSQTLTHSSVSRLDDQLPPPLRNGKPISPESPWRNQEKSVFSPTPIPTDGPWVSASGPGATRDFFLPQKRIRARKRNQIERRRRKEAGRRDIRPTLGLGGELDASVAAPDDRNGIKTTIETVCTLATHSRCCCQMATVFTSR